jgi:serpin B
MDRLLAGSAENSCVSPLSYKFALAMAYNGADGDTLALLAELFGISPSELNVWVADYLADAKQYDGSQNDKYSLPLPELRIANSYWVRESLESEISQDFTDLLVKNFTAKSGTFDTSSKPINKWVSKATNAKIKNILEEDIDHFALSYLVNAVYFNAQWISAFKKNATKPGEFTNSDGSRITTDMLYGNVDSYINTEQFEGIAKYLSEGFEFTAVMPKTIDTMTLGSILEANKDNNYDAIILTLPKFNFETQVDFKLGSHPELDALFANHGMDRALSENAKTENIKIDGLSISNIIQKTVFTLAEAGIEASAATLVEVSRAGLAPQEPQVVEVVFDRPFYFTLSDKNGELLFFGKVMAL